MHDSGVARIRLRSASACWAPSHKSGFVCKPDGIACIFPVFPLPIHSLHARPLTGKNETSPLVSKTILAGALQLGGSAVVSTRRELAMYMAQVRRLTRPCANYIM